MASGGAVIAAGCLGGGGGTPTPGATPPEALPPPALGAASSAVVVRVWEDFACPHCRTYHERVLPELREGYLADDRVRYEHHDFPIPVSRWSWPTALAARSVQATAGEAAFWTFAEGAYEQQDALGWPLLRDLAAAAGADPEAVENEAREERWRPVVAADRRAGRERGVEGTPSVYVNDEAVSTGGSWDAFSRNIAAAVDERLD